MNIEAVINELKHGPQLFSQIKSFSERPGIYAFFYVGKDSGANKFPIETDTLIYIGKTESSQKSRDANTHFKSGKTGSSTVRKSLGAILAIDLDLKPIPRNDTDYKKGRKSHFKFDETSEERLTQWMMQNIAMTYYEFDGEKDELDSLETNIIQSLIPPLNIDHKNPENPYATDIKRLRKNCASIANESKLLLTVSPSIQSKTYKIMSTKKHSGLYGNFWAAKVPLIAQKLKTGSFSDPITIKKEDFNKHGNRKDYAFNIQFKGTTVENSLRSSAVARDLRDVLLCDEGIKSLLVGKRIKIKMGKDYLLWVSKN